MQYVHNSFMKKNILDFYNGPFMKIFKQKIMKTKNPLEVAY